jgi:hypothetical protein
MARLLAAMLGLSLACCSADDAPTKTVEVPSNNPPLACLRAGGYPATPPPTAPAGGSKVSAAHGAKLEFGRVSLVIPPGALAQDIELELLSGRSGEDYPGQDPLDNELVYSFYGILRLPLALPATLGIKPFFAVSAGMHPVLAQTDEHGRWIDLETRWEGDRLTASISSLSGFVPRRVKLSTNNCSFDPCGGKLEGKWFHAAACGGPWKTPSSSAACTTSFYSVQPIIQGSLTFTGGTFSSVEDCSTPWSAQIPFACVDRASCVSVASGTGKCTTNAFCSCDGNLDREFRTRQGTFMSAGTTMTLVDESSASQSFEYCVQGDSLVLEGSDGRLFELVRSKP